MLHYIYAAVERTPAAAVVGGSVTAPWWIEWLKAASEVAGYLLPIIGLVIALLKGAQLLGLFPKQAEDKD